jgi:hypothetical protein
MQGTDLALALAGVFAAVAAVGPDRLVRHRRGWLPSACLLAAVAHLAVRPLPVAWSVVEAILVAGYLALSGAAEMCWGSGSVRLRWASAPVVLATVAAAAAGGATVLAHRIHHPLFIAVPGIVAVAVLMAELYRRRGPARSSR